MRLAIYEINDSWVRQENEEPQLCEILKNAISGVKTNGGRLTVNQVIRMDKQFDSASAHF